MHDNIPVFYDVIFDDIVLIRVRRGRAGEYLNRALLIMTASKTTIRKKCQRRASQSKTFVSCHQVVIRNTRRCIGKVLLESCGALIILVMRSREVVGRICFGRRKKG